MGITCVGRPVPSDATRRLSLALQTGDAAGPAEMDGFLLSSHRMHKATLDREVATRLYAFTWHDIQALSPLWLALSLLVLQCIFILLYCIYNSLPVRSLRDPTGKIHAVASSSHPQVARDGAGPDHQNNRHFVSFRHLNILTSAPAGTRLLVGPKQLPPQGRSPFLLYTSNIALTLPQSPHHPFGPPTRAPSLTLTTTSYSPPPCERSAPALQNLSKKTGSIVS